MLHCVSVYGNLKVAVFGWQQKASFNFSCFQNLDSTEHLHDVCTVTDIGLIEG